MELSWIVTQLGARENYAVARAVHAFSKLDRLITDVWVSKHHPLSWLPISRLRQRTCLHIPRDKAISWPIEACLRTVLQWQRLDGGKRVMAQNHWFKRKVRTYLGDLALLDSSKKVVFSYSYAALESFTVAKNHGWKTVLGQIDCGPNEEAIVGKMAEASPEWRAGWRSASRDYWGSWRKELALADRIIVNSQWSYQNLVRERVPQEKIDIIPLAFEAPAKCKDFVKIYPSNFTRNRPMRVLFLGQINLRKGAVPLLQAARALADQPIQIDFVGPVSISIPPDLAANQCLKWHGPVPRSDVEEFYKRSDVFIFPTFSDGFGLTQLEAQAWKLPMVVSRYCGEVVKPGMNGIVLPEVSSSSIVNALLTCLSSPELLSRFSKASTDLTAYSVSSLGNKLAALECRL